MSIRHAGVLLVAVFTLLAAVPATSASDDATFRFFEDLAARAGFDAADLSELVVERTTTTPDGVTWTERFSGPEAFTWLVPFTTEPSEAPDTEAVLAIEVVAGSAFHGALDFGCDPLYERTQIAPGVAVVRGGPWTDSIHWVHDPANALQSGDRDDLLAAGVWTHDPTPLTPGSDTVRDRGIDAVGALTTTHTEYWLWGTCSLSWDTTYGTGVFTFNLQEATP